MELDTLVAALILLAAFVLIGFSAYIKWTRLQINLPTPEYYSFLVGHGHELRKFDVWSFYKWAEKYGLVYQLHVYHYTFVLAVDYRWIREFCSNSRYVKPHYLYEKLLGNLFGMRVMGYGLVTNCKPAEWLKHRVLLNPAFHKNALSELSTTFNEYGDRMIARLSAAAEADETLNVWDIFGRVAMDIIARTAFAMNTDMLNDPNFTLRHCIYMYFKGENMLFVDPLLQFRPSKRSFIREVKKCCIKLREIGQRCIAERFDLLLKDSSSVPNDALTMLLRGSLINDKNLTPADLEWIIDEFVTLFIAGHETTALTLAVTMYELDRHPNVYKKVMEELELVLADRTNVTMEDLNNLRYLDNVIKESLRVYPPAPGTVRETTEVTNVFGVKLPARTHVCLSFHTAHMWPDYFENPLEFIPERFECDDNRLPGSYAPFSMGPRICLGKDFAMIEAKILLAKLLKSFKYSVLPEPKFEIEQIATLRLKNGIACKFTKLKCD